MQKNIFALMALPVLVLLVLSYFLKFYIHTFEKDFMLNQKDFMPAS